MKEQEVGIVQMKEQGNLATEGHEKVKEATKSAVLMNLESMLTTEAKGSRFWVIEQSLCLLFISYLAPIHLLMEKAGHH